MSEFAKLGHVNVNGCAYSAKLRQKHELRANAEDRMTGKVSGTYVSRETARLLSQGDPDQATHGDDRHRHGKRINCIIARSASFRLFVTVYHRAASLAQLGPHTNVDRKTLRYYRCKRHLALDKKARASALSSSQPTPLT